MMKNNKFIKLIFPLLAGIMTFLPLTSMDAELNEEPKAPSDLTIYFESGSLDDEEAVSIHFGPGPSGAIAIHFGPGPSGAKVIHFGPGPSGAKVIHFGPGPASGSKAVTVHFGPGPASGGKTIAANEVNQKNENLEKLE